MAKKILGVEAPTIKAEVAPAKDKNCPYYGNLNVKNTTLVGEVIKKDASGSATIEWTRTRKVPKYERFEYRRSRIRVHNPLSINAQIGDKVLVARTRPISKTKHHVIIKVIGDDIRGAGNKKSAKL
jgi:small subunit ribosomal protein S17